MARNWLLLVSRRARASAPMRPRQPVEIVPRQMLQQLMKYAIVMAHGIDPPLVSGSFPNNPRPSGINAVRYVQQKMYRTAVGLTRPSTLSGATVPVSVDARIKSGHDG